MLNTTTWLKADIALEDIVSAEDPAKRTIPAIVWTNGHNHKFPITFSREEWAAIAATGENTPIFYRHDQSQDSFLGVVDGSRATEGGIEQTLAFEKRGADLVGRGANVYFSIGFRPEEDCSYRCSITGKDFLDPEWRDDRTVPGKRYDGEECRVVLDKVKLIETSVTWSPAVDGTGVLELEDGPSTEPTFLKEIKKLSEGMTLLSCDEPSFSDLKVEPEAVVEPGVEPEAVLEVEPEAVLEVEPEAVLEVEPEAVPETVDIEALEARVEARLARRYEALAAEVRKRDLALALEQGKLIGDVNELAGLYDDIGFEAFHRLLNFIPANPAFATGVLSSEGEPPRDLDWVDLENSEGLFNSRALELAREKNITVREARDQLANLIQTNRH